MLLRSLGAARWHKQAYTRQIRKVGGVQGHQGVAVLDRLRGDPQIVIARARRAARLLHGSREHAECGRSVTADIQYRPTLELAQIRSAARPLGRVGTRLVGPK